MTEALDLEKKIQPRKVITCPHCKYEYLPCEVLYAEDVVGKIKYNSIVRDAIGHILYCEYDETKEPLAEERFVCENCGKNFIVEIDPRYSTREEIEELDFSNPSVELW